MDALRKWIRSLFGSRDESDRRAGTDRRAGERRSSLRVPPLDEELRSGSDRRSGRDRREG